MTAYPQVAGPALDSDPRLAMLFEQLQQRHHGAISCALIYGSCLRSGDLYDGLLDLYLICDSYRAAYQRSLPAIANWMLPPNVFYAEQSLDDNTLRSKVTVISLRDFQRGCSQAWFESYIWGRFAQPTCILFSRDEATRTTVEEALLQATRTLLCNAVPALPGGGTVSGLWQQALALSYATELRTERGDRAQQLAEYSRKFFEEITCLHANSLEFDFTVSDQAVGLCYESSVGRWRRRSAAWKWSLRKAQGKLLSILRLVKALFTFEGGLDYIAWKLERHTGEKIVIPDRVRRAPLIFIWGFFWKLYRRGIFK